MKNDNRVIFSLERAKSKAQMLHQEGKVIVFTNGCFDLLHAGHVDSLAYAKDQGDTLFVGVNDDESVRRLKGARRPILPLAMRAKLLSSLRMVDFVVPFAEDTALAVVKAIQPDVYVKGEDYRVEDTPEGQEVLGHGGRIAVVKLVPGVATTSIIEKILNQYEREPKNTRD